MTDKDLDIYNALKDDTHLFIRYAGGDKMAFSVNGDKRHLIDMIVTIMQDDEDMVDIITSCFNGYLENNG